MASRFPHARSYLGPPALYELRDLGDVQSAQVEVMRQNVLGQLHQEAAVDPLPLEHSHRCLREADESQAGWHLLQRQHGQVGGGPPVVVGGRRHGFRHRYRCPAALRSSGEICGGVGRGLRRGARGLAVERVQGPEGSKAALWGRRPQARRSQGGEGVHPRLCPGCLRWLGTGRAVRRDVGSRFGTSRVGGGAVCPGAGVTVEGSVWRGRAAGRERQRATLASSQCQQESKYQPTHNKAENISKIKHDVYRSEN